MTHSPPAQSSDRRAGRGRAGYSLIEMVVVAALLAILAAVALPVVRYTTKRTNEAELRYHLRTMRNAIDEFKRYSDAGLIPLELGADGYPPDLETLVEGSEVVGQVDKEKRFLRRIPVDPMTGEAEWGMRSYQDDPDSGSWGGENVYDVYSLSEGVGLNGVPYSEW
ncbi:MAG TPA: prepilin-type N-terminal cleavage/methylation domain-containing protein [Thermoanaerobaculia bacterium]|nr:prepilin-type N-terminal cleavage/methylation domain-containing protein [Thermoanaerobaculia bacterium]